MLISSKFFDYYDPVRKTVGVDKTIVYNRDTVDFEKNRKEIKDLRAVLPSLGSSIHYRNVVETYGLIGFCGGFFPFIRVKKSVDPMDYVYENSFFYDLESLTKAAPGLKLKGFDTEKYETYRRDVYFDIDCKKSLELFFEAKWAKPLERVFRDYKTPAFFWGENYSNEYCLRINPRLSDYEFAKAKDPFTAYQDIYLYISGVLGTPANPLIQISDKDMQYSKGFDHKYSFRKPPGKRGKKQWR